MTACASETAASRGREEPTAQRTSLAMTHIRGGVPSILLSRALCRACGNWRRAGTDDGVCGAGHAIHKRGDMEEKITIVRQLCPTYVNVLYKFLANGPVGLVTQNLFYK